jgi:hypothetical protein
MTVTNEWHAVTKPAVNQISCCAYPARSFMYFWHSLFGTLRAFSCKLSLKRSLCRIGAGGSASRGAMGLPAARQRVCRQGEPIKLVWCTRGRSTRILVNFLVCRRPCTERDLASISSYVMTGNNQKASVSGYKSSDRLSKPILRGKHSLSEPRKVSAIGLPVVPRSPLLALHSTYSLPAAQRIEWRK